MLISIFGLYLIVLVFGGFLLLSVFALAKGLRDLKEEVETLERRMDNVVNEHRLVVSNTSKRLAEVKAIVDTAMTLFKSTRGVH